MKRKIASGITLMVFLASMLTVWVQPVAAVPADGITEERCMRNPNFPKVRQRRGRAGGERTDFLDI